MSLILIPDSIEELTENPTKYGMPTFEQFRANKEKWLGRADDEIAAIDRGDPILGCKQQYVINGYRVKSLHVAERIARDMGFSLFHDFIIDPQIKPDSAGGFYNEVRFWSKNDIAMRANSGKRSST